MNDDCPICALDFDRGEPGYFTGAMYVSYALVIPVIALLTLIEHLILPKWSLFRLVILASLDLLAFHPGYLAIPLLGGDLDLFRPGISIRKMSSRRAASSPVRNHTD